jgi:5'-nucleotidase (lipoprotein e(P4) family)
VRASVAAAAALLGLSACAATPRISAPPPPSGADAIPAQYQYLFGSGEAGALQMGVFHSLLAYARDKAAHRPEHDVVFAPGSTLAKAIYQPCGDKPLAVVFDIDETLLLNLGFEARAATGEPFDPARWDRWEKTGAGKVAPLPGAIHAVDDLRKMNVTVVFNSNRNAGNAAETAAALRTAGLGNAVHGETLFLQGDGPAGPGKDGRRALIAARYCVIAMAGDQLGDFTDLFAAISSTAARRQTAVHSAAAGLWGEGWFMLPNPVYGSALKGGLDDAFPADKRWADPAEEKK